MVAAVGTPGVHVELPAEASSCRPPCTVVEATVEASQLTKEDAAATVDTDSEAGSVVEVEHVRETREDEGSLTVLHNLTIEQRRAEALHERRVKEASLVKPPLAEAAKRLEAAEALLRANEDLRREAELEARKAEANPRVDLRAQAAASQRAAQEITVGSRVRVENVGDSRGKTGKVIAKHAAHPLVMVRFPGGEERWFKATDVVSTEASAAVGSLSATSLETSTAKPGLGSLVVIMNNSQMKSTHQLGRVGQVGTLREIDQSIFPCNVEFLDGSEWFRACDVVALASSAKDKQAEPDENDLPTFAGGLRLGDRVRRKIPADTNASTLRHRGDEAGIVIDGDASGRVSVRFPSAHGSRNVWLFPEELCREAEWHQQIVAQCREEEPALAEDVRRMEKEFQAAQHTVGEAIRAERDAKDGAVKAARCLHKQGKVAERASLVASVAFSSDSARPRVWREVADHVAYKWALRVGRPLSGAPSVLMSLGTAAALARAVAEGDVDAAEERGSHVLQVRSPLFDRLVKHRGYDERKEKKIRKRGLPVLVRAPEAKDILRKASEKTSTPSALSSFGLLKAALGVLDNIVLDPPVQAFFDSPETGIIRAKHVDVPEELKATLRSYQLVGYQWLVNNARNGLGCILADDMGLGKTLQAIALLLYLKQSGQLRRPALVVVPTGLIPTWQNEVSRWAPSLRVHTYHGVSRSLLACACPDGCSADATLGKRASVDVSCAAEQTTGEQENSSTMAVPAKAASLKKRKAPAAAAIAEAESTDHVVTPQRTRLTGKRKPRANMSPAKTEAAAEEARCGDQGSLPEQRAQAPKKRALAEDAADIFLTSYGTLRSDVDLLTDSQVFGAMILDEAQQIKNYNTLVTKAAKKIAQKVGSIRIALSGTPVENRLSDLHSQFEFTLPGYLAPSRADFERDFAKPIATGETYNGQKQQQLLQRMIQPFVLRRLKTDPNIASDLPDKVEQLYECELPEGQAALYRAVQASEFTNFEQIEGENGAPPSAFRRRARVLSMMHALRETCNHPANLKAQRWPSSTIPPEDCPSRASIEASGKCVVLRDILSGIMESGEKALIFCQYLETIDILAEQIKASFKTEPLRFTGDLENAERQQLVEAFQTKAECRVMLLSLQAGGVGITLTAATHVIHFDRCYNPARENQATDRAHRIGQTKTVFVHRLVARGTFEERMAEIMQQRQNLSDITVQAGEQWIADLDNTQLRELFALNVEPPRPQKKRKASGQ